MQTAYGMPRCPVSSGVYSAVPVSSSNEGGHAYCRYYTHQPPNGPQAWPPQGQGTPFRGGGNPFKGGGKWKHDLFEELTQPLHEAKPAAPVEISAAAAVTTPVALASEADKSV